VDLYMENLHKRRAEGQNDEVSSVLIGG
jgi:hypothetical protein